MAEELGLAVQARRAVRQLSGASLAAVPLDAIATAQPQLHFRVAATLRALSLVNADALGGGRVVNEKRRLSSFELRETSDGDERRRIQESLHLCRLCSDMAGAVVQRVKRDDAGKGKGKGKAKKKKGRAAAEALAAAATVAAAPPCLSVVAFRGFQHGAAQSQRTEEEEEEEEEGEGDSAISQQQRRRRRRRRQLEIQQAVGIFRSFRTAAVHAELNPSSLPPRRRRGRAGQPEAPPSPSCFGVALLWGSVNHPLLEGEMANAGWDRSSVPMSGGAGKQSSVNGDAATRRSVWRPSGASAGRWRRRSRRRHERNADQALAAGRARRWRRCIPAAWPLGWTPSIMLYLPPLRVTRRWD